MKTRWHSTPFKGVRFYRHPTRRHGKKPDLYFAIRYQKEGERIEEGCGFSSDGWTAERAALLLADLKKAAQTGESGSRLSERREKRRRVREAESRDKVTFCKFWEESYLPGAEADKTPETMTAERSYFKAWISPAIGALPLKVISPLHLEKIKAAMKKDGKSPRSAEYCLAIVRQLFNEAKRRKVFIGENPANNVKFPRTDNRRQRFFTKEEADALLAELAKTDPEAWEMALLSLHTGLRAGEIFSLCWGDIDTERGTLFVKDTKSRRNRFSYMTGPVREMLLAKKPGKAGELVFPGRGGVVRPAAPRSVRKAIEALKLNEGRADRREKAVFHTFRHTHASWLVQNGVGLYAVKEALGHSTTAMAARYSHLAPENLQQVARTFEAIASKPAAEAPEAAPAAGEGGAK